MKNSDLKQNILKFINTKADDKFLNLVNDMAETYQTKNVLEKTSIEEYNKELRIAEQEIDSGNFYTSTEVKKLVNEWGKK